MRAERIALLTIDLQNDFLHPDGAYGRAGQTAPAITALPARIAPVRDALRTAGVSMFRRSSLWCRGLTDR